MLGSNNRAASELQTLTTSLQREHHTARKLKDVQDAPHARKGGGVLELVHLP